MITKCNISFWTRSLCIKGHSLELTEKLGVCGLAGSHISILISLFLWLLLGSTGKCRFRKGRGTRDQIANICRIIKKAREFQKNIYFCFIDYAKAFDCVDHNKLENSLRDGMLDHLTYLLRNLYAGQEAIVRTGHGTTDWFQIVKRVRQGCI